VNRIMNAYTLSFIVLMREAVKGVCVCEVMVKGEGKVLLS